MHWQEFVTEEQLASVQVTSHEDLVDKAGVAKFGTLFPTGKNVRLSPVKEILLSSHDYWDLERYLDLDTGQMFSYYQGVKPENLDSFGKWCRQVGVDVYPSTGFLVENQRVCGLDGQDMHTWQIENSRWESFEAEIHNGAAITLDPLGPRSIFSPSQFDNRQL